VQGPLVGGRELTPKHSSRQGISVGKYHSAERTTYKTNLLVMSGLDTASQSKSTTSGDDEGQHHNLSSHATHLFHQEDSHQPPLSLDFSGLSGTEDGLGNHVVNHIDLHDPRGSLIGDLHRVGDHPKLDEMTILEAVNPSDTHEDTQESRDTDPDIKRVKVSHAYIIYHLSACRHLASRPCMVCQPCQEWVVSTTCCTLAQTNLLRTSKSADALARSSVPVLFS
jgi:hypothetical protein